MKKCILCNNNQFKVLYPTNDRFFKKFISKKFYVKWFMCKKCSLIFRTTSYKYNMNLAQDIRLFKIGEEFFIKEDRILNQFNYILGSIFLKNNSRILDVGCGSGMLLNLFKKHNFKVYGIEPDVDAYRFVCNLIGKDRVFKGTFEEFYKKVNKKFDLIILSHVLEHTPNPINFLKKVKSILNSNGFIYIEIPYELFYEIDSNTASIIARGVQETILPFYMLHFYSFTPYTLLKLLNKVNLYPLSFSIYDIAVHNPESMKNYKKILVMRVILKNEKTKFINWQINNQWNFTSVSKKLERVNRNVFKIHKKLEDFLINLEKQRKKIVIYGAGYHTLILLKKFPILLKRVRFFIDDDKNKQKELFFNKEVKSLEDALSYNFDKILISSSIYEKMIYNKLRKVLPTEKIQTIYLNK